MVFIFIFFIAFIGLRCGAESFTLTADIKLDTTSETGINHSVAAIGIILQRFHNCSIEANLTLTDICKISNASDKHINHRAVICVEDWCKSFQKLNQDIQKINEYFNDSTNATANERKRDWPVYVLSIHLLLTKNNTNDVACNSSKQDEKGVPNCTDMAESSLTSIKGGRSSTVNGGSSIAFKGGSSSAVNRGTSPAVNRGSSSAFKGGTSPIVQEKNLPAKSESKINTIVGSTVGAVAALSGLTAAASFIRRKFKRNRIDPETDDMSDNNSVSSNSPFFIPSDLSRPASTGPAPTKTAF